MLAAPGRSDRELLSDREEVVGRVERAQAQLELEDPRTMARYLLVSMQGLAVIARSDVPRRALRKIVNQILAPLRAS